MSILAIQGHPTKGNKVIEILEMLGGVNTAHFKGENTVLAYYIEVDRSICCIDVEFEYHTEFYKITLEEFEENFPYKVGNRVKVADYESEVRIDSMSWDGHEIQYQVFTDETEWYSAKELNDYNEINKEETMKQIKIDIPKGYEFFGIDDDNKIVLTKIQPQYPKTYEECCENVFGIVHGGITVDLPMHYSPLFIYFAKLLICRDAYWKIAGDKMRLGKPWESDFTNNDEERYGIYTLANKVEKDFCGVGDVNMILVFPTEEMRDTFYNNFKDLIEQCKELL